MFKNGQNIAISKRFLVPLLFVLLIFTSFGVTMEDNYAIDLNQSDDGIMGELNLEDKLGNSHENIVNINSQEDESLNAMENNVRSGTTHYLNHGGTFDDIRSKVNLARRYNRAERNFQGNKSGRPHCR